jgi:hypothetical protein
MFARLGTLCAWGTLMAGALVGCGSSDFDAPELCSLPFEVGPCDAAIRVYAAVDGSCEARTYGGCEGNENRFSTLEECLATCEGRPDPYDCPEGRARATICIACGPAGGCGERLEACAQPCNYESDCTDSGFGCTDGVCQLTFCE